MKKLFCALLSAAAAVALLCGFAPLEQENGSTTRSYETAAGVQTLNISDKCATVTVESADVDHIIAEYTYSTAYGAVFPGEELYTFTLDGSTKDTNEAKSVLEQQGVSYQNIWFASNSDAGLFTAGLYAFPTTYVVDRNGRIVGDPIVGAISSDAQMKKLNALIDQALS